MSEPTRDEEREAAIRRVVDAAPPITAEQIVTLRRIFAGTRPTVARGCDLPCDDDCEAGCHQAHLPHHKRHPDMCRCAAQGRTP